MAQLYWWIFDEPFRFLGDDESGKLVYVTPDRTPELRFATEPGAVITSFTLTDRRGNVLGPFVPVNNAYDFVAAPAVAYGNRLSVSYGTRAGVAYGGKDTSLSPGRYIVKMTGTDASGRTVTAQSAFRIVSSTAYGSRLGISYGSRAGLAYGTRAR